MLFGYTILATALCLSMVAAYYSIAGLTAIFSAATIPIIIMGAALELGKIVATVFLHRNWSRLNWGFKGYLVPAVAFLMMLTSLGIYGFLSKAHSDQTLVSGDSTSQVAIFDERIKTEKDIIDAARRALKQMDEGVDQIMVRSNDERGADKSAALRRAQQKERSQLQADITKAQKSIAALNEQRAPLAANLRKVEAEVGPIKYIAALIYGDNPDAGILEKSVRWVIILIVVVFDPLALCLILAGNRELEWAREDRKKALTNEKLVPKDEQPMLDTPFPIPDVPATLEPSSSAIVAKIKFNKLRLGAILNKALFKKSKPPEPATKEVIADTTNSSFIGIPAEPDIHVPPKSDKPHKYAT